MCDMKLTIYTGSVLLSDFISTNVTRVTNKKNVTFNLKLIKYKTSNMNVIGINS